MRHASAKAHGIAINAGYAIAVRVAFIVLALLAAARVARAETIPIVLDPPTVMDVSPKEGPKSPLRYYGQAAKQGRIDLTATNGFFDRCFEALDQQKIIPGDEGFIGCSFGYLGRLSDTPGSARWHLWCAEAGQIKATFFMQVAASEANHPWLIKVGDETQTLRVKQNDGQSPQEQSLTFTVKQPGKVTFAIDCTKTPPAAETRIYFIRLEGSAVNKASLLRARWRPSAVHAGFFAPPECPTPNVWVFESRPVDKTTSYSPLTTPFGYFGTSFDDAGRVPTGAGFNFSMWIAGRSASKAPEIQNMARLIGTDLPDAEYGTFGGEGTGVKFRNAVAYPNGAERTIQALRIDTKYGVTTFYGYFYDEQAQRWKLYASAQKPSRKARRRAKSNADSGGLRHAGSFCEIPGPPNRERSGDLVREIKRRGWFYGSDQQWYRATFHDAPAPVNDDSEIVPAPKEEDAEASQSDRRRSSGAPLNQRNYYMPDFAAAGWMAMATGGIEFHTAAENPPRKAGAPAALPEYLSAEKTKQLFELPVDFGESKASEVSADHATIDYEIKKTGPHSKALLYYGTVDCLTYPPQQVSTGSAVQIDMFRPERTWRFATPEQKITTGMNPFKLGGLKPGTTYYYRLFVTHDLGKSWDYQTGSFKTE